MLYSVLMTVTGLAKSEFRTSCCSKMLQMISIRNCFVVTNGGNWTFWHIQRTEGSSHQFTKLGCDRPMAIVIYKIASLLKNKQQKQKTTTCSAIDFYNYFSVYKMNGIGDGRNPPEINPWIYTATYKIGHLFSRTRGSLSSKWHCTSWKAVPNVFRSVVPTEALGPGQFY